MNLILIGLILLLFTSSISLLFFLFYFKQKNTTANQTIFELNQQNEKLLVDIDDKNKHISDLKEQYITEKTKRDSLKEQIESAKQNQKEFKETIENQFKLIAQNILEQKSDQFKNLHLEQLQSVINPFKTDVSKLEKRVNEVHDAENKQRASLEKTIENLISISSDMKIEANKLSTAIISDNKQQGNWGEIVLERLFESAGLQAGIHYEIQKHISNQDDGAIRPDAIINLPDNKKIIIDSKVSIKHYYESLSAENEQDRKILIKAHYQSVLNHIKGLSSKQYNQKIKGAFNYVLMFIPFESGLSEAMNYDSELYNKALRQNILLVSPSTLLVSLTAIQALWQSEYQRKNIEKIAEQGSKIYDKAKLFIDDIEAIGNSLNQLEKKYEGAKNKLYTGRGNLVNLSETMKKLGVQTKSSIDSEFLEKAELSEDSEPNSPL